ncbi:MAG: hypothetical protein AB7G37_06300 [Solirubrobacteraceae bacterium]
MTRRGWEQFVALDSDAGGGGGGEAPPPAAGGDAGGGAPPAGDPPAPPGGFDELEGHYQALLDSAPDAEHLSIPRSQVQGWMKEHKDYRQKWGGLAKTIAPTVDQGRFVEALDGMHEQDQAFFVDFLWAIRRGDDQAVKSMTGAMRQVLDQLSPAEQQAALAAAEEAAGQAPAEEDEFDPLDPKAFDDRVSAQVAAALKAERETREREAAVERTTGQIRDLAKELAVEHDIAELGDATSDEYHEVMSMAKRRLQTVGGDALEAVRQAAGAYRERLDKRAQALLKAKTKDVPGGAPATPRGGDEPSGQKKPKSMAEARASAEARLEALSRTSPG